MSQDKEYVEENYISDDSIESVSKTPTSNSNSESSISIEEKKEDIKDLEEEMPPPKYLKPLCAYLGATAFMGFTACINAIDFFLERCPGHPEISQNVARIINFGGLGAQILTFPFVEKIGANIRILVSQLIYALVFLFLLIYMNLAKPVSLAALYTALAFDGVFFGVIMVSTNGFCGLLARSGAPYAIIGNALAGVFSTVLRIVSKPIGHDGEGWFYFGVCFTIVLLGEIFLFLFQFTDYYKFRMKFVKKGLSLKERLQNIGRVVKKCWLECLQAVVINCTAYTLYPGYATSVDVKHESGGFDRSWAITIIISCYMFGDFFGRTAARWWKLPGAKYVWIAVCLRFIFFPLYIIAIENVVPKLNDEIWICICSFFLSFSGGYFLNLSQAYTSVNPTLEKCELEIASFTISFCIGVGTSLGCVLSYAMPVKSN